MRWVPMPAKYCFTKPRLLAMPGAVRINYEILGNLEPALHVHIFPRFDDEAAELKTRPVWFYNWDQAPKFDPERDAPLMNDIRNSLRTAGIVLAAHEVRT